MTCHHRVALQSPLSRVTTPAVLTVRPHVGNETEIVLEGTGGARLRQTMPCSAPLHCCKTTATSRNAKNKKRFFASNPSHWEKCKQHPLKAKRILGDGKRKKKSVRLREREGFVSLVTASGSIALLFPPPFSKFLENIIYKRIYINLSHLFAPSWIAHYLCCS